ncbi:MAG TPA: hypothetical protein VGF91_19385 [Solirubrobacteraceae bacterium]|jgi:hypothetical protein
MNEKQQEKWQRGASSILEPGERVELAVPGWASQAMWKTITMFGVVGMTVAGKGRVYLVTDRNVYVCQTHKAKGFTATKVLDKRPLADARLSFDRKRVALDEMNHVYVGWLPSAKRRANQFVAAGALSTSDSLASA